MAAFEAWYKALVWLARMLNPKNGGFVKAARQPPG
jgi:hypothetical protein